MLIPLHEFWMTPPPSGEEVSGVELQPAGLCGALPESVPAAEERHGGAVRTADGLRPRPPTRLLRRPAAALHPQSDARTSASALVQSLHGQ